MTRLRHLAVIYFFLQGVAVALWWLWLESWPGAWRYFTPPALPVATLEVFILGDLAFIALGSVLVRLFHRRAWAIPAAWLVAGATLYASATTIAGVVLLSAPLIGAVLMIPAAIGSVVAAAILTRATPA